MFIVILKTSNWGNSYNHKDIASVVYTFQISGIYNTLFALYSTFWVVYTFQTMGRYNNLRKCIPMFIVVYTFQIGGSYNLIILLVEHLVVVYTFQIGGSYNWVSLFSCIYLSNCGYLQLPSQVHPTQTSCIYLSKG
jgi:hypothetical protein